MEWFTRLWKQHPGALITGVGAGLWALWAVVKEPTIVGKTYAIGILLFWAVTTYAFQTPLKASHISTAAVLNLAVPLFLSMAVWVQVGAIYLLMTALAVEGFYWLWLIYAAWKASDRWLHQPDTEGDAPQASIELQEAAEPEARPAIPPRKRKVLKIVLSLGALVVLLFIVNAWNNRPSARLQRPEVLTAYAEEEVEQLLKYDEIDVRQCGHVYLYSEQGATDQATVERLAQQIRVRLYVPCTVADLPEDRHQIVLEEPAGYHIVLQTPVVRKEGLIKQAVSSTVYRSYLEREGARKDDAPIYRYGVFELVSHRGRYWLTENHDDPIAPPTVEQSEQIALELEQVQKAVVSPELAAFTEQMGLLPREAYNGYLEWKALPQSWRDQEVYGRIEVRWTNGKGDETLASLLNTGIAGFSGWSAEQMQPVAFEWIEGRYVAPHDYDTLMPQWCFLLEGKERFYQVELGVVKGLGHTPAEGEDEEVYRLLLQELERVLKAMEQTKDLGQ